MKTIKLTVEQAQQLYAKDPTFRETILHEFTDLELGIEPKPFTWYDLGTMKGVYISQMSEIKSVNGASSKINLNTYPCTQDAEQALAKCMILQLARHYNKCEQHEIREGDITYSAYYSADDKSFKQFMNSHDIKYDRVKFIRKDELEKCIEDNEELFKTFLGVNTVL